MARPIEPTPEIDTQEDLDRFLANMKKPTSKDKNEQIKRAKEVYAKAQFINHLP